MPVFVIKNDKVQIFLKIKSLLIFFCDLHSEKSEKCIHYINMICDTIYINNLLECHVKDEKNV